MEAEQWFNDDLKLRIIIFPIGSRILDKMDRSSRRSQRALWFYLFKGRSRYHLLHFTSFFHFVVQTLRVWCVSVNMVEFFANVSNSLALSSEESTVFTYEAGTVDSPHTTSLLLRLHTIRHFNRWDKGRILEGQPWHFAQSVTVFAAPDSAFPILPEQLHYVPFWVQVYGIPFMCKSQELAKFIASEIGDLVEVDQSTVREGIGPYLRIRVLLDVNLPIRRSLNVRFIKLGREIIKWIDFKYEQLPEICYFCGKLDHTRKYCHAYLQKCDESPTLPPCPFTILLRGKEKPAEKVHPFHASISDGIMIPTHVNPNNLTLNTGSMDPTLHVPSPVYGAYSTDSILVANRASCEPSGGIQSVQSSVRSASISAFKAVSGDPNAVAGQGDHPGAQPDSSVRGKGLASASGVKRASFQSHQLMVGGSLRETLKRARANDNDDATTLADLSLEQAGVAGHSRPGK
uniref:Zinc knuckle CX2CX4HX4C domain-containing protein n=1 Tax=Cannabis sativa TaxID=3483 RepID=A0A803PA23_CANSA